MLRAVAVLVSNVVSVLATICIRARTRDKQALSVLTSTNVGIQGRRRILSKLAASSLHPQHDRSWIPTFVGMSGVCCRLRRPKLA
ncbi:MAG: hypothetical protein ABMA14_26285 [Hyphomonadaceae bacterium]